MLYLCPNIGLSIKVNRFSYFFKQRRSRIRAETETNGVSGRTLETFGRVVQPPGSAQHRHGTVSHAVHLIQPARLVQRRHQEDVGAGFDLVRQWFACIAFVNADALRRLIVPTLEEVLVFARTGSQGDKESAGVENAARSLSDQVITLLAYQTRNDPNDGPLGLLGKPKPPQQIEFAFALAAQVIGGKISGDIRVGFRIPNVIVDAMGDPYQAVPVRPHQPIESITLLRRLNLAGISRAHRRQNICGNQAGLQSRSRTLQHEIARVVVEPQPPQIRGPERALIGQVMNRKDNPGFGEELFVAPPGAHLDRGRPARPVVTVQDVRRIAQSIEQGDRRPAEKNEAFEIVYLAIDFTASA